MGKVTIREKDSLMSGDVMSGEMKISSPVSCFVGNKMVRRGWLEYMGGFLIVLKTAENFKDWASIGPSFGNGKMKRGWTGSVGDQVFDSRKRSRRWD